jgi:hypothetical protein
MSEDALYSMTPEEEQVALARVLLRQPTQAPLDAEQAHSLGAQKQLGLLGQLSGDRVLAPVGSGLLQRAEQTERAQALVPYHQAMAANGAGRVAVAQENADSLNQYRNRERYGLTNVDGDVTAYSKSDPTKTVDLGKAPVRQLVRGGKAGGGGGGGAGASAFDSASLDHYADELAANGSYPNSAKGKAGQPYARAIEKRALELHPDFSAARAAAGFHADTASLQEGVKQADVTDVSEGKALADIGILEKQMKPLADTGSPLLNKGLRALQEKSGDPQVAAMLTARVAAVAQINKVINSGTLTESARKEAEELVQSDATMGQLMSTLGVLKQDMARSKEAMHQRVSNVQGRMSGKPAPQEATGAAPASAPALPPDVQAKASARIQQLIQSGVTDKDKIRATLQAEGLAPSSPVASK